MKLRMGILVAILIVGGVVGYRLVDVGGTQDLAEKERIAQYKKQRRAGDLQVGDEAPDFKLEAASRNEVIQLSSFRGKRDVVLIFGSYT